MATNVGRFSADDSGIWAEILGNDGSEMEESASEGEIRCNKQKIEQLL